MENLYSVDRLVSDNEPNGNVYTMESYDFTTRDPAEDTYWDEDLDVDYMIYSLTQS